ncbi:hypothetical protein BH10PSE12_BH10PSE12_22720 [soil metagenome]
MATVQDTEPKKIEIGFDTKFGKADDAQLDAWELKHAKRALMNLKTLLNGAPMLRLLEEQIMESDRRAAEIVAASNGEFKECRVDVHVKGMKVADYIKGMSIHMAGIAATPELTGDPQEGARDLTSYEEMFFPAHPEHYVKLPGIGGVETIGGLPIRLTGSMTKDLPDFAIATIDPAYVNQGGARIVLHDGTVWCWVLHQFRDTQDGMDIILRAWFPAAAPDIYCDGHSEHFSVEFRNFIHSALAAAH